MDHLHPGLDDDNLVKMHLYHNALFQNPQII